MGCCSTGKKVKVLRCGRMQPIRNLIRPGGTSIHSYLAGSSPSAGMLATSPAFSVPSGGLAAIAGAPGVTCTLWDSTASAVERPVGPPASGPSMEGETVPTWSSWQPTLCQDVLCTEQVAVTNVCCLADVGSRFAAVGPNLLGVSPQSPPSRQFPRRRQQQAWQLLSRGQRWHPAWSACKCPPSPGPASKKRTHLNIQHSPSWHHQVSYRLLAKASLFHAFPEALGLRPGPAAPL